MDDLRKLYEDGVNVIEHLTQQGFTRRDAIELSYDLQSGTYVDYTERHPAIVADYTGEIAEVVRSLGPVESILEVGCGEATTLTPLLQQLPPMQSFGCDLAWSRVRFGMRYAAMRVAAPPTLFVGDLMELPFPDASIDVVYSYHSLEPNGGQEAPALRELHRVARRHVVLFEPDHRLADPAGQARMERLGYVRDLRGTAERLGYTIVTNRPARVSKNPANPTELVVLQRQPATAGEPEFRCPFTHRPLRRHGSVYASDGGLHVYPVVDGIPCITRRHGIVATHFTHFLQA